MRQPYPKDYATHIPVLVGLSRLIKPKRILEFGAGRYSTPLFLNRDVFPCVEYLLSNEPSYDWAQTIMYEMGLSEDQRIVMCGNSVGDTYDVIADDTWDLVFVDSDTVDNKVGHIRNCLDNRKGLVVVHDSEVPDYRFFMKEACYVEYNAYEPTTSIFWVDKYSGIVVDKAESLGSILWDHRYEDPTDVNLWLKIFKENQI